MLLKKPDGTLVLDEPEAVGLKFDLEEAERMFGPEFAEELGEEIENAIDTGTD